jgi:ATP-binding cassette subfamily B protein
MEENKRISFSKFIWKHVKNFKIAFFFMFFLSGFIALERVYIPNLMGKIIDILGSIKPEEKIHIWSSIGKYAIYGLIAMLSIDVFFRIQEFIFEKTMPKFAASIRLNAYEKTLYNSARFFSNEHVGDVGSKINDLAQYNFYILSKIVNVFSSIFLTVLLGIINVFFINKILGLLYLSWLCAHIGITVSTASFVEKYYKNSANKLNFLRGKIIDGMNNVLNIRLFSKQKNEIEYIRKFQNEEIDAAFCAGLKGIFVRIFLSFATILGLIFVFYNSVSLWQKDLISIGQLNAVLFILLNTIFMVWWFSYEFINFITDIGKAKASFAIFENESETKEDQKNPEIKIENGKIEFVNVSFSHNGEAFFQNQNIIINPREKIGLVGYSGSGKTTLANLILREFDLDGGQILIDDQDISSVNLKSLKDQITYITQNVLLFHRTIRENLLFAKQDATEEELIEACKAADCFDFIKNLDHGFDTDIGEQGSKLSGGQKQRISIARGILKGSKIVILDEATSALDSITEKKIQKAFDALSEGKTTIVIAHRLSTLINVDRILVFNSGKIIEIGNHDELMKLNGFYAELYKKQFEDC